MALSLLDGVLTWQKVKNALVGANPATQNAFKDLRQYLATQGQNPQLQFVAIDGTYSASDGGNNASQVLADSPCTLYGIYLKKVGATEVIFKGSNNATTATTDGTQDIAIASTVAGDAFLCYPTGRAQSAGFTAAENTTRTGSTKTLTANRQDGFVIVGA